MAQKLIRTYFEADHDRLESLFGTFQKLKRGDIGAAKRYFRSFMAGLKRHIEWEERLLFPLFEVKSGVIESGPTAVMRSEHRTIEAALDAIARKVSEKDPDTDGEEAALLKTLGEHNEKEENILYPSLDEMISREEAARVFLDMEEVPKKE